MSLLDLLLLPRKYKRRDRWFKVDKVTSSNCYNRSFNKIIFTQKQAITLRISAETYGSPLIIFIFFNKAQLNNYYPPGKNIVISGDLTLDGSKLTMIHPDYSVNQIKSLKSLKLSLSILMCMV